MEKRLIDANALMERLEFKRKISETGLFRGLESAMAQVKKAPTLDAVEVVHGEWFDGCAIHNGKEVYQSIDCSVCEEVFKIESHDREYWKKRFKACPFCGAIMDGGNEDG